MARTFGGGSTDAVTVTAHTGINNFTDLTVTTWVYRTGAGGSSLGRIVCKATGSGNEWNVYHNDSVNATQFDANKWGTTTGQWRSTLISLNTLTHVGWTYSFSSTANNAICYINGVAQTTTRFAAPSGSLGSGGSDFVIGNNAGGGSGVRVWAGRLMHACYWNRALSAGEMMGVYKAGPMRHSSGLVLWVPVWGTDSPEPNYAPQGDATRNGTVVGTSGGAANLAVHAPYWFSR